MKAGVPMADKIKIARLLRTMKLRADTPKEMELVIKGEMDAAKTVMDRLHDFRAGVIDWREMVAIYAEWCEMI